jgi:hypothetical protein
VSANLGPPRRASLTRGDALATLRPVSRSGAVRDAGHRSVVEIVLRTETPEGTTVVLAAIVYAKILEEHAAVADLALIDRTVRRPDERRRDPRPGRERFFRREDRLWVMAVVEYGEPSAIIVTVFSADRPPS